MKNMEKEPKIEKSLEEKLSEKGYRIEKAQLSEDESRQCGQCMGEDKDFRFYQEGWMIEGNFYCFKHKEKAMSILGEIDKDVERRNLQQERIIEERRKRSGLK